LSVGNKKHSPDDIPEAMRDVAPIAQKKKNRSWLLLSGGLGFRLLGGIVGVYWWEQMAQPPVSSQVVEKQVSPENSQEKPPSSEPVPVKEAMEASNDLLGHLPYEEADLDTLTPVTADGRIKIKTPAAKAFIKMQSHARREGVRLVALSGFRSIEEQEYLFFAIKAQRGQVTRERAEVSAPPGYSEHHTGYAIDIGDATAPATHVEESFEKTEAFAWLEENAARYSFELSFPRDNSQNISYEPWHWRYVGNQESLKIFYKNK